MKKAKNAFEKFVFSVNVHISSLVGGGKTHVTNSACESSSRLIPLNGSGNY